MLGRARHRGSGRPCYGNLETSAEDQKPTDVVVHWGGKHFAGGFFNAESQRSLRFAENACGALTQRRGNAEKRLGRFSSKFAVLGVRGGFEEKQSPRRFCLRRVAEHEGWAILSRLAIPLCLS